MLVGDDGPLKSEYGALSSKYILLSSELFHQLHSNVLLRLENFKNLTQLLIVQNLKIFSLLKFVNSVWDSDPDCLYEDGIHQLMRIEDIYSIYTHQYSPSNV